MIWKKNRHRGSSDERRELGSPPRELVVNQDLKSPIFSDPGNAVNKVKKFPNNEKNLAILERFYDYLSGDPEFVATLNQKSRFAPAAARPRDEENLLEMHELGHSVVDRETRRDIYDTWQLSTACMNAFRAISTEGPGVVKDDPFGEAILKKLETHFRKKTEIQPDAEVLAQIKSDAEELAEIEPAAEVLAHVFYVQQEFVIGSIVGSPPNFAMAGGNPAMVGGTDNEPMLRIIYRSDLQPMRNSNLSLRRYLRLIKRCCKGCIRRDFNTRRRRCGRR
jgi:hypothetical protein